MEQDKTEGNVFKKSGLFRLIILLMFLLNVVYVSIEIYKAKISNPLLGNSEVTKLEFAKLETLSNYTSTFETAFLLLSIIGTFLIFIKRYKPLLKSYIVIQLTFLTSILILNNALAWIFDAPTGNMTQLLFGPFTLLLGVLIYFVIKGISRVLGAKGM